MTQEPASVSRATADSASSFHAKPGHSLDVDVRFETPAQAKQRRRRTSPRDYAILEAAYLRNSKPDKHDRAQLVRQVNLGEKEVQIWFQNRRQNDRRKSKPLLPHELIPHFRNGVPTEAAQQLETPDSSQESSPGRCGDVDGDEEKVLLNDRPLAAAVFASSDPASDNIMTNNLVDDSSNRSVENAPETVEVNKSMGATQSPPATEKEHVANISSLDRPSFTRKRSHEEMDQLPASLPNSSASVTSAGAKEPLRRSSSVRLSMMADGAVKVRLNNEPTPSPPKKRPSLTLPVTKKASGFTRSHSAIEGDMAFQDAANVAQRVLGRSRDARTWEFFCDRDAQDALAMRAEEDGSGSAIGAINLMRSASQKKSQPLSPNLAKQNFRRSGQSKSLKPLLTRSHSSLPRLQGVERHAGRRERDIKKHRRAGSGNDSDKENWAPGTRGVVHLSHQGDTSALMDTIVSKNSSSCSPSSSELVAETSVRDSEDLVSTLVRKDKAKGDDLDCIQGLLSLSQGAWR